MKILSLKTIHGPSVYHHRPTLSMKVDLEKWADVSSAEILEFTSHLLQMLPGLQKHTCSPGYEGGFVERLHRGTYMAHIIEHIALELSDLAGIGVSYGKTRYAGQPGVYQVVTRFTNEEGMKKCLQIATQIADIATRSTDFNIPAAVEQIKEIVLDTSLGPSTAALFEAAKKRNIPARRLTSGQSLIQLGQGRHVRRIQTAVTDNTNLIATDIAQDKKLTKKLLEQHFLPVPYGEVIRSELELEDMLREFAPPYVIKPLDGNHGNGVSLNLTNREDARAAYAQARNFCDDVLIEEMCEGRDYRVLVVNGKLAAAAERKPPLVVGDGKRTIVELIAEVNSDPRRSVGHTGILTRIEPDAIMMAHLKKQGLDLSTIPAEGEKIVLRENANLSSGGTAADVTDKVHSDIRLICERAARVIGLDICGLDLICKDISRPQDESVKIIEVNAGPGLRMHLAPSSGQAQPVAEKIIEMMYPRGTDGRIPVLSVTGTNGKTSVTRMLHKIFSYNGHNVGMTTTDGIWIGKDKVFTGDTTGPQSAQVVLSDPTVDTAVLEVARGGLLRSGLAYDWSDVSVITNIAADHIGQDGIESVEDILWIKSLVAERVREGGTLVLNADDPLTLSLKDNERVKRHPRHIFLFSLNPSNPAVIEHLVRGGSACWVHDGWVHLHHRYEQARLVRVADIPCTLGGIAQFQISNVIAAISAAVANGMAFSKIVEAVQDLNPSNENVGRTNLYKVHGHYVLVDYGHNEPAFTAVGKMVEQLKGYNKIAIVGLPGDRDDQLLKDSSVAIATYFDHVIAREEKDLRGRLPGEVPALICKAATEFAPGIKCERIVDEVVALQHAIATAPENSLIAIFYEDVETVRKALLAYDPEPVREIPMLEVISPVKIIERFPVHAERLSDVQNL